MLRGKQLSLFACTHYTAPLKVREQLSLCPEQSAQLRTQLLTLDAVNELFLLCTCNRIEVYLVSTGPIAEAQIGAILSKITDVSSSVVQEHSTWLEGQSVLSHLFEVSSGVDSQIIGETEILGQVKDAFRRSIERKELGPVLHKALEKSLQVAKWVRTHTSISNGQVSVGSVVVDISSRVFGELKNAQVLVLGGGYMARLAVKSLAGRGCQNITIACRKVERAKSLAYEVEGRALEFNSALARLSSFDIIIGSTSAPNFVLHAPEVEAILSKRHRAPMLFLDLAVPRDFDESIGELSNAYLFNYDDLSNIANRNRSAREDQVAICRREVDERAERLWDRLNAWRKSPSGNTQALKGTQSS